MQIAFVGINPLTAPDALWRKAYVPAEELAHELSRLRSLMGVSEAVIVLGARRLECYVVLEDGRDSFEMLAGFLAQRAGVPASECMPYLYMAEGADAAGHLFNVACLQDSFALEGEPVLEQIRSAISRSRERRASGPLLGELFMRAVKVAETVDAESGSDARLAEISAAAFGIIERVFDDLPRRGVLLIGDGRAGEFAARRLHEAGVRQLMAINGSRQLGSAVRSLGAVPNQPADLEACLAKSDIVLSSADTRVLAVDACMMRRVRRARRGRPLLVIDFSEAGNIDEACADIDDVYLYGKHDLERLSEVGEERAGADDQKILDLVLDETLAFSQWLEEAAAAD